MRFSTKVVASAAALFYLIGNAVATGINCEGSTKCGNPSTELLEDMTYVVSNNLDQSRFYNNGEQIICSNNVCAYCQKSGGAPGSSIVSLMELLLAHGCDVCGSIPLFYPSDNNVDNGELTVDYASSSCSVGQEVVSPHEIVFTLCS